MVSFRKVHQFHAKSCVWQANEKIVMRIFVATCLLAMWCASPVAHAQDIPGIEICTAEKAMDRRTSCLQSNIDFLQKTMTKQSLDQQQKLDAANRQVQALKAALIAQQGAIDELKARPDLPTSSRRRPMRRPPRTRPLRSRTANSTRQPERSATTIVDENTSSRASTREYDRRPACLARSESHFDLSAGNAGFQTDEGARLIPLRVLRQHAASQPCKSALHCGNVSLAWQAAAALR